MTETCLSSPSASMEKDENLSISPCVQSSEKIWKFGSKEWANDQLRFAIRVLKGEGVESTFEGRIAIALYVMHRLEDMGFWWQAERINNWMHRFQRDQPRGVAP